MSNEPKNRVISEEEAIDIIMQEERTDRETAVELLNQMRKAGATINVEELFRRQLRDLGSTRNVKEFGGDK